MDTPFNRMVIPGPGFVNPMPAMPAEQFGRSIDRQPLQAQGGDGGGSGSGVTPPLWLTSPDSTHLKIQFGQVSGFTPSGGWAGGGDDVGVSVDISGYSDGTYNIYLDATVDASTGAVSAVTVTANTSAVPSDTSTNSYRLVGQAVITSGAVISIAQSLAWSQTFVACTPGDPTTYFWLVA